MRDFIEREAWQVAEIQEAIKEADAGDFATDEEVQAVFKKWGFDILPALKDEDS